MWCGYNDEVILMHTNDGTIYRSRDRGMSWKRMQSLLAKQGLQIVDDDQDVSEYFFLGGNLLGVFDKFRSDKFIR